MTPLIKKPKHKVNALIMLIVFIVPTLAFVAATQFKVSKSNIVIEGTSTLHDWTLTSNSASGAAIFEVENGELNNIQGMTFSVPAKSLKSGKSMMDNNTYDELKADKHSNIIFKLTNSRITGSSGNKFNVTSTGNLTVAGVTKPVSFQSIVQVLSDNEILATGSTKMKMTDFNIKPPVMMLGQLKTGDEMTIKYNVRFAK